MDEREQQRKVRHRLAMLRHAEEVTGNVAAMSRRAETSTSMTWPCWSTPLYTYRQVPATFT